MTCSNYGIIMPSCQNLGFYWHILFLHTRADVPCAINQISRYGCMMIWEWRGESLLPDSSLITKPPLGGKMEMGLWLDPCGHVMGTTFHKYFSVHGLYHQYNLANNDRTLSCGFSSVFHYTVQYNIGKYIKALTWLRNLLVSAVSAGIKPPTYISYDHYWHLSMGNIIDSDS